MTEPLLRFERLLGDLRWRVSTTVHGVAFAGGRILVATFDDRLTVLDEASGAAVAERALPSGLASFVPHPDGRHGLSRNRDASLRLWNLETGEIEASWSAPARLRAIAAHPDGRRALSAGGDGQVAVWDLATRSRVAVWPHCPRVTALCVSPDGARALTGDEAGVLQLRDAESGRPIADVRGPRLRVHCVGLLPDGKRAISSASDGVLRLWNLATGEAVAEWTAAEPVIPFAISADGRRAVLGHAEGAVTLWDVAEWRERHPRSEVERTVTSVAFSADGSRLRAGGDDGRIVEFDLESGRETRAWKAHEGAVAAIDRPFRTAGADGVVKDWDEGRELAAWKCPGRPERLIALRGNHVLYQEADRSLRLWDVSRGEERRLMTGDVPAVAHAEISDGFVMACWDSHEIRYWGVKSGTPAGVHRDAPAMLARLFGRSAHPGCRWLAEYWDYLTLSSPLKRLGRDLLLAFDGDSGEPLAFKVRWGEQAPAMLTIWDRITGECHHALRVGTPPASLAVHGSRVAVGHVGGQVSIVRWSPPPPARGGFFRAAWRHHHGDLEGALADVEEAMRKHGPEALHLRAHIRQDLGDLEGAIADFTEALGRKTDFGTVQSPYCRGLALQRKGDHRAATADFKEALRLNRDSAVNDVERARQRLADRDLRGALADLTHALARDPRNAEALLLRGRCRREKGDLAGALDDFTEGIRLNPDIADAHRERGECLEESGELDDALEAYDKVLAADENDFRTLFLRGHLWIKRESFSEAAADLTKALALAPPDSELRPRIEHALETLRRRR